MLLTLFAVAVASFVLALLSLRARDDLMAIALCVFGGLALRALHQAARHAEGSR